MVMIKFTLLLSTIIHIKFLEESTVCTIVMIFLTYIFFYVLLTVHLSIILVTDQLNAQIPALQ